MKFTIVALALLGVIAADVSHLNNMYLPPVLGHLSTHQHVSHDHISHEIPQVAVQEVNDNSVAEAEQTHLEPLISQHVHTAHNVAHQVQAHVQQQAVPAVAEAPVAPGSQVYQSSFEQTVHQTSHQQQPEAEQQQQQYYSGAVEVQQEQQPEVVAPQAEEVQHHVEHHVAAVSAPSQQADYYGQQQSAEHHVAAVSAPSQQVDYYGQQQSAGVSIGSSGSFSSSSSSSSSGVDTQYAVNGGYVY